MMQEGPLPPGWKQQVTPEGQVYYYNTETRESSYTRPTAAAQQPQQSTGAGVAKASKKAVAKKRVGKTKWFVVRASDNSLFYFNKETKRSAYTLPDELKSESIPQLGEVQAEQEPPAKKAKPGDAHVAAHQQAPPQPPTAAAGVGEAAAPAATTAAEPLLPQPQLPPRPPQPPPGVMMPPYSRPPMPPGPPPTSMAQHRPPPPPPPPPQQHGFPPRPPYPPRPPHYHGPRGPPPPPPPPPHMHGGWRGARGPRPPYGYSPHVAHPAHPAHRQQQQHRPKGPSLADKQTEFKKVLAAKNVSAFALWETVRMEIEGDPTFKALTEKQAKSAFNKYQESKLDEEKSAVMSKAAEAKKAFRELLEEANVDDKTTWVSFKTKWQHDKRFKAVTKEKDRDNAFREYVEELLEKDRSHAKQQEQHKKEAFACFEDLHVTRRDSFRALKRRLLEDERCKDTDTRTLESWFREYQDKFSSTGQSAIKKREAEVASERRRQQREMARASQQLQRGEGRDYFKTLLANRVRTHQTTWEEALLTLQADTLWAMCNLPDEEKQDIFHNHLDALRTRARKAYTAALDEALERVGDQSGFDAVMAALQADRRVAAFSASRDELEQEFEDYVVERKARLTADFKALLRETKCITHTSWSKVSEHRNMVESPHMKEIQDYLEHDKRYHMLESDPTTRATLLVEYMRQLESKGAPPPPTASNPEGERQRGKANLTAM